MADPRNAMPDTTVGNTPGVIPLAVALSNIINSFFALLTPVSAPAANLAPPLDDGNTSMPGDDVTVSDTTAEALGGLFQWSKRNTVESDTGMRGSNIGCRGPKVSHASDPTRYISANDMFSIPTIDVDPQNISVPAEFGPPVGQYEFFKSQMNVRYQLPSVDNVGRYTTQNGDDT